MKLILARGTKTERSVSLYRRTSEVMDKPRFDGQDYVNRMDYYYVFVKSDQYDHALTDYLSTNFLFLQWNAYDFFVDGKTKYMVVYFWGFSKKEMTRAIRYVKRLGMKNNPNLEIMFEEQPIRKIEKLALESNYQGGDIMMFDSVFFPGINSYLTLNELSEEDRRLIDPSLLKYFDAIHFDSRDRWLVEYNEGGPCDQFSTFDDELFHSFPFSSKELDLIVNHNPNHRMSSSDDSFPWENVISPQEDAKTHQEDLSLIIEAFHRRKVELLSGTMVLYFFRNKNWISILK